MKKTLMFSVLVILFSNVQVFAQVPSSSSYQVPESSFSSGGELNAQSASFSSSGIAGILAVGVGNSTSYTAIPGFITPNEEYLELAVQTANVDLGVLDTGSTATGTGLFMVRTYLNGSYVVYSMSAAPTSESGAILDPLTSPTASVQGSEQFGMNLVANTTPSVGADPAPDPTTAFANGEAAANYDTQDSFTYNQGDIIAQSGSIGPAWGRTNFTISYIANISSITEAGTYVMEQDIVLTSTY